MVRRRSSAPVVCGARTCGFRYYFRQPKTGWIPSSPATVNIVLSWVVRLSSKHQRTRAPTSIKPVCVRWSTPVARAFQPARSHATGRSTLASTGIASQPARHREPWHEAPPRAVPGLPEAPSEAGWFPDTRKRELRSSQRRFASVVFLIGTSDAPAAPDSAAPVSHIKQCALGEGGSAPVDEGGPCRWVLTRAHVERWTLKLSDTYP